MRYTVTQFARESVGLCPLRGWYVRELLHTYLASQIIKITHAHNLHVKALDKHVSCCSLNSCFFLCRNKKGLLNFESETEKSLFTTGLTYSLQLSKISCLSNF